MRRALFALALVLVPRAARATAGTALGDASRPASLAGSVSARPGDAGSMLANPAGLADVTQAQVLLTGNVGQLAQSFARVGEPSEDHGRALASFGLALAAPLPGPLSALHLGFALATPAEHALRVAVPTRLDQPQSPLFDGRPDRISALFATAIELTHRIRFGVGLQVTPSLDTPTEITYVAGRDKSIDKNVVIRLDRDLALGVSPLVGVRITPTPRFSLAFVYRAAAISRASGSQRTVAGGILADDPIHFFQMWDPSELVLGAALRATRDVSFSLDGTVHAWSQLRTGFDGLPDPPPRTTASLRGAVEWRASRPLTLRAGWALEPTPLREQVAATNYLAQTMFTFAGGAGVDLRALANVPVVIDAHARLMVGARQTAHKERFTDANPDLPGLQIDDLGYPAFSANALIAQLGLTATVFLGAP